MLDWYLKDEAAVQRMRALPGGSHLDAFAAVLCALGYARDSIRDRRRPKQLRAKGDKARHRVFEPTAAQWRYLLALETTIEARLPVTDLSVSKQLKMSRQTIFEWKQDPRFRAWLHDRLNRTSEDLWPFILRRHELLAIQGSVKSAEFIAKVRFLALKVAAGVALGGQYGENSTVDITTDYDVHVLVDYHPEHGVVRRVDARPHINLLVPRPPALEPNDDEK
jgi:hypothetical protein